MLSCRWDAGQQAVHHALGAAPSVSLPHPTGAGGVGPQRQHAGRASAEDHHDRDHCYRGRVGGEELALHDVPEPVVFLQLLHAVPQQVHPVAARGRAWHAG